VTFSRTKSTQRTCENRLVYLEADQAEGICTVDRSHLHELHRRVAELCTFKKGFKVHDSQTHAIW